jgi:SNF2 family DNA or RNA helicase
MDNKGATRTDELKHRLSFYMVRRLKKDVLKELPDLRRQTIWVEGTKEAAGAFERAMGLGMLRESNIHEAIEATLEAKIPAALDLAEQAGKFLLFTWLKRHAKLMHEEMLDRGVPNVLVYGEDTVDRRRKQIALAAAKGWGVVATIDAAGAGLNLQGITHYGIMHAIHWRPNMLVQGEGRLHRIGQTHGVQWTYLAMKDSIDQLVIRTVVEKLDYLAATMGTERGLRNALDDNINGAGQDEKALLKAIYDSL